LSVEELLRTQITSVGRKAQQVAKAPAAVYVITQEDIRRSGATNIPDLLRIVPGLVVARINGSTWAISARGDAKQYSQNMLVLVDGRSVYSRLFSGVFWNTLDLLLEDIDRIEVIRGPGAVMWGSNAVNGVISIITKRSQATQGGLVTLGTGTDDRAMMGFRYGGRRGDRLSYRFYGKFNARQYRDAGSYLYRPDVSYGAGTQGLLRDVCPTDDDGQLWRTGFRMDWERSARDTVTLLGEVFGQRYQQSVWLVSPGARLDRLASKDTPAGGNFLARWTHTNSPDEETTVQFWVDRMAQNSALYQVRADMVDGEVQHRRQLSESNEMHVGGGYRWTTDSLRNGPFQFRDGTRGGALMNAVIRDEHQLIPGRLTVSAGLRAEHNGYTGFEWQPSVRLLYTPSKTTAWWLAWSRAVRTPSRIEADVEAVPIGFVHFQSNPVLLQVRGSDQFRSEQVGATETGFRLQRRQRWTVDLALFYNRQTRKSSVEFGELEVRTQPFVDIRQNTFFANNRRGSSRGGELALTGIVRPWWRMQGSYSYQRSVSDPVPGFAGLVGYLTAMDPGHQARLQSFWNAGRRWQADVSLFGVGPVAGRNVPGYLRADARLSWRPDRHQDWSVVAQDLFNNGRLEWAPDLYVYAIPARRAVVVRWTVQF
jgi:iron complex outermembrane receptor protein